MNSKLFAAAVVALPIMMATTSANALLQLRLSDGVNPALTIMDNGAGDTNALGGLIVLNQGYNNWAINVVTGMSKPVIGDPDNPRIDLGYVNLSNLLAAGAPENLKIEFTDTDFLDTSLDMVQRLIANWGGTTQGTSGINIWADAGNATFGKTTNLGTLGSFGPGAFSTSNPLSFANGGLPYSLTVEIDISHNGLQGQASSGNFELIYVPEPGTLALFGLGLVGLGYVRRKRQSCSQ